MKGYHQQNTAIKASKKQNKYFCNYQTKTTEEEYYKNYTFTQRNLASYWLWHNLKSFLKKKIFPHLKKIFLFLCSGLKRVKKVFCKIKCGIGFRFIITIKVLDKDQVFHFSKICRRYIDITEPDTVRRIPSN